jgi:hypothetical protein
LGDAWLSIEQSESNESVIFVDWNI